MRTILTAVLLTAISMNLSLACCMLPATYEGTISQNAHEAVLIHHNGREELVLRIDYHIEGATMPDQFAWVITVPHEPDNYALADAELFEEMFDLSESLLRPQIDNRSLGLLDKTMPSEPAIPNGVELGMRVQVGPYDIQPVRGVGANALTGLNNWLKKNNFPTEDPAHMKYFVDGKFTFLAVRIAPPKDKKTVGSGGKVPPLHLSFKTEKPYYPLRFSSRQGVFDVNLHVLTKTKLDYKVSDSVLRQINWTNTEFVRNYKLQAKQMPETLKDLMKKTTFRKKTGFWYFNNIRGDRVNRKENLIANWKTDVFFNGQPKESAADTVSQEQSNSNRVARRDRRWKQQYNHARTQDLSQIKDLVKELQTEVSELRRKVELFQQRVSQVTMRKHIETADAPTAKEISTRSDLTMTLPDGTPFRNIKSGIPQNHRSWAEPGDEVILKALQLEQGKNSTSSRVRLSVPICPYPISMASLIKRAQG
jgi:hypothetical protein